VEGKDIKAGRKAPLPAFSWILDEQGSTGGLS
jgi:hypothetical protein